MYQTLSSKCEPPVISFSVDNVGLSVASFFVLRFLTRPRPGCTLWFLSSLVKALVNDVAAHAELFSALEASAQELGKAVSEAQLEVDSLEQESDQSEAEDPVAGAARLRARFEELRGAVEQRLHAVFSMGEALTTFLIISNRLSQELCAVDAELRAIDRGETADQPPALRLAVTPCGLRLLRFPPHPGSALPLTPPSASIGSDSASCVVALQRINEDIEKHAKDVDALKKAGRNLIRGSAGEELDSLFAAD